MTGIAALHCHMHHRAGQVAVGASPRPASSISLPLPAHTVSDHPPWRARPRPASSSTSVTRRGVDFLLIRLLQRTGNGMIGIAFRQRRQLQQPLFRNFLRDGPPLPERFPWSECRFCQTPRISVSGQRLQIVAALDQNPRIWKRRRSRRKS